MQCANCGFQNMPGSPACIRCGTSLNLATAAIAVYPPRAGMIRKRVRRMFPLGRLLYRARDLIRGDELAAGVARARHSLPEMPPRAVLLRCALPGLPHFYLRQNIRAYLYLGAFLFCMIPTILFYGSTASAIWLGLAFSVHSTEALDVVTQAFPDADQRARILRSIYCSVCLAVCVYVPAGWAWSHLVQSQRLESNIGQFRPGDVILTRPLAQPSRGDVVLYDFTQETDLRGRGERRLQIIFAGQNVDRVLAIGGDRFECRSGRLWVNGSPSPWRPLNPWSIGSDFSGTLAADQCLIVPSGLPVRTNCIVPVSAIHGRAILQNYPLSRFHWIR